MREELAKREALRGRFRATFKRYGRLTQYRGADLVTLLFVDVRDEHESLVTDHIWFRSCKQWEGLKLEPGERVSFEARVRTYRKGYRGRREFDGYDAPPPPSIDYRLSHPTKAVVISRQHTPATHQPELL